MKLYYIGQYQPGSTSRMRGEVLAGLLVNSKVEVIDTNIPISETGQLFKSIGWRYYRGPLITRINRFIKQRIGGLENGDVVWVDKGVFIDPEILAEIKQKRAFLFHYTPDTAFVYNRSDLFFSGVPAYDACITTKSFEIPDYEKAGSRRTIFCTQGYNPDLHRPLHDFNEKEGICFVGLAEPNRLEVISLLAEQGFPIKLGGVGWQKLVNKYACIPGFTFLGERVFGEQYANAISSSLFGLGLLSKRFPELHTTRTFEIPACGTALVTEDNKEIRKYYQPDEVIYFNNSSDMADQIRFYNENRDKLKILTAKGNERVRSGAFDYPAILREILVQLDIL